MDDRSSRGQNAKDRCQMGSLESEHRAVLSARGEIRQPTTFDMLARGEIRHALSEEQPDEEFGQRTTTCDLERCNSSASARTDPSFVFLSRQIRSRSHPGSIPKSTAESTSGLILVQPFDSRTLQPVAPADARAP